MREIEFRSWDIRHLVIEYCVSLYWFEENFCAENGDGYILMQYTGLKDKNGVKIFEGDIVKAGRGDSVLTAAIDYDNNVAAYVFRGTYCFVSEYADFEVIGNIYENPELLEGKNV